MGHAETETKEERRKDIKIDHRNNDKPTILVGHQQGKGTRQTFTQYNHIIHRHLRRYTDIPEEAHLRRTRRSNATWQRGDPSPVPDDDVMRTIKEDPEEEGTKYNRSPFLCPG